MKHLQIVLVLMLALVSACIAPQPATPGEQAVSQQAAGEQAESEHEHALPQALGEVDFAVSCTPEAQAEFNHGAALLHSFWFPPAIQSFKTVAELDPTCAMAHWGVAMSRLGNPFTWPLTGQALVDGWAAFAVLLGFMILVFGAIPFTDAIIVRFVDDQMRSRVSGVRLAISFGVSSLAVWLLGPIVKAAGFDSLLLLMAGIAACTLLLVLMLPAHEPQAASAGS